MFAATMTLDLQRPVNLYACFTSASNGWDDETSQTKQPSTRPLIQSGA